MATITSAQSGNWSSTSTWVGGVVPVAADTAVAASGHIVAIDVDVTVVKVTQAGTGKFTLGNGRTLTATVEAIAGTPATGGTVQVTATTDATITGTIIGSSTASVTAIVVTGTGVVTINGNLLAGSGSGQSTQTVYLSAACTLNLNGSIIPSGRDKRGIFIPSSTLATVNVVGDIQGQVNGEAIYSLSANTVNVTGNVTGGNETNFSGAYAISMNAGGTINITGNVRGGSIRSDHYGIIIFTAAASVNVVGNVDGGSASSCIGIYLNANNSTCTITGSVSGGTQTGAHGVFAPSNVSATVSVVGSVAGNNGIAHGVSTVAGTAIITGNLTDSTSGVVAVLTRQFRIGSNNGITRYANNVGFPSGGLVSRVSPDNVTGMPAASNVRSGQVYGYNNELTGTLAVPPAGSVASGVPVGNTVGTAVLSAADLAAMVGAQIAAAVSSPPVI